MKKLLAPSNKSQDKDSSWLLQPSCKTKVLGQDTRCHSCVTKIQSQVAKVNLAAKLQCQVTEPRHPAETRVASIFPPRRTAKLQSQGAVKELLAPSN